MRFDTLRTAVVSSHCLNLLATCSTMTFANLSICSYRAAIAVHYTDTHTVTNRKHTPTIRHNSLT